MIRRQLNLGLSICLTVTVVLILNSCKHTNKSEHAKPHSSTKAHPKITPLKSKDVDFDSLADSIYFFNLDLMAKGKGDTVGFVSVSDIDALPGSLDSPVDSVDRLVIPDLENKTPEQTKYLLLTSKYRKRLLKGTGISDSDSLFVYDYAKDILLSFPISSLKTVASLSGYEDASEAKHSARDYQLGFQIDRTSLNGLSDNYFNKVFVYIGSSSPFARGQMHPVIWEKTDPKKVPAIALKPEDLKVLKGHKFGNAYHFESDGFRYYLQEYVMNNEFPSIAYRMLIMNEDNEVISNYLDYESESSSPAPISVLNDSKNILEQWTGHLLKNRPPVLVGFDYVEFGCDIIPFVDKSARYIRLNCDNRH
jgi:hypothetical protein